MSEYIKGLSNSILSTGSPNGTDTTDPNFQGSDWQPNMFYDPDASKKDVEVTIKASKLKHLQSLLAEAESKASATQALLLECQAVLDEIATYYIPTSLDCDEAELNRRNMMVRYHVQEKARAMLEKLKGELK